MTAWERVEDLHRAFEPLDHNRTGEDIRNIIRDCEDKISELERITNEANGLDDVDWLISLLQDAMYEATYKLTRRVPGVSFNELRPSGPILISDAFDFPFLGAPPSRHNSYSPDSNFKVYSHWVEDCARSSKNGTPRDTQGPSKAWNPLVKFLYRCAD